jgi:hypothetical protein
MTNLPASHQLLLLPAGLDWAVVDISLVLLVAAIVVITWLTAVHAKAIRTRDL